MIQDIHQLKEERQNKVSDLIKACLMFFAFSNDQFEKNKTPLQEGEKYVSTGYGGYLPKGQIQNWINGGKEIDKWYKSAVKDNKLRKANIIYELSNHEAWYTGEIEDTLNALGEDYTAAEVQQVFNSEYNKQLALRD